MKALKSFILISILILAIFSCKKEEAKYGTSITPIKNVTNLLGGTYGFFRDEPTIMSTSFKSSKEGRITEFGIIAGKGTYTVSLWDSTTQSLISSIPITVSDSTVYTYKDVSDINIVPNKVYIISMFNQIAEGGSGAQASKLASGFPYTQGDITIIGSYYVNTSNPAAFPGSFLWTFGFIGITDIKFEPKL